MKRLVLGSTLLSLVGLPVAADPWDDLAAEARQWMPVEEARSLDDLLGPLGDEDLPDVVDITPATIAAPEGPVSEGAWGDMGFGAAEIAGSTPVAPGDMPPEPGTDAARDGAETPGGAAIARVEPPADWVPVALFDNRFSLPPGWQVMEDRKDSYGQFTGDMNGPKGQIIMLALERDSIETFREEMEEEGGELRAEGSIEIDGGGFHWVDMSGNIEGLPAEMLFYFSDDLYGEDEEYLIVGFGSVGGADRIDEATRTTVLGAVRLGQKAEPAPGAGQAPGGQMSAGPVTLEMFNGLIRTQVQQGWGRVETHETAQLDAPGGVMQVQFLLGQPAQDALAALPHGADFIPSWQGGHPAREFASDPGSVTFWEACPEPGRLLAMKITGREGYDSLPEYKMVLGGLQVALAEGSPDCREMIVPGGVMPGGGGGASGNTPKTLAPPAAQSAPAPTPQAPRPPAPPQVATPDQPAWGEDSFEPQGGGYALYRNARYGMSLSFPSGYFEPDPAPGSGDGRRFTSKDGQASFYVFAQYDALDLGLDGLRAEDRSGMAHVYYDQPEQGAYQMAGTRDGKTVIRRVIRDHDGLTRVFEISYPPAREAEFAAVVAHMAGSFGPPPALTPAPVAVPQPPAAVAVPQPQAPKQPPAQAPARTTAPIKQEPRVSPPVQVSPSPGVGMSNAPVGRLYTPQRGTTERAAIMDAARVPIVPDIGQYVIFKVQTLNSDGRWAYLQATPLNGDGTPLNWRRTNYARDWAADVMSDIVMVLLYNDGGGWSAVDWVVGPTDVAWMDWVPKYLLPIRLFQG